MAEIADLLRRIAQGETTVLNIGGPRAPHIYDDAHIFADGYEICIHNDAGSLDYVDWAKAPDGRRCEFNDWYQAAKRVDEFAEVTEPLEMLSEKEQDALHKALTAGRW